MESYSKQTTVCSTCLMDTSDPLITFNNQGICSYCQDFKLFRSKHWYRGEEGKKKLDDLTQTIKREGKNKEYDCLIGLSGGVDSSYVALLAKETGLRPLCVHVDAGWNSELAVKNIENIVKKLNFDLYTYVVDWEEMRDLQLAFLKAGLPNQDIPQDDAFVGAVYKVLREKKIKYLLSGGNIASENTLPSSWGFPAFDLRHLKAVHKLFGTKKLRTYPAISFFKIFWHILIAKNVKVVRPLNFIDYNKENAMRELQEKLGWRPYEAKHCESTFTKFFQRYYLPTKFGFDKRKAHLSSLIIAGQLSREEALIEMKKPLYDSTQLKEDKIYVSKKLGISLEEFERLIKAPNRSHAEYPSYRKLFILKPLLKKILKGSGHA